MSSHHIVRDEQEPALLFMDSATTDAEIAGQLLEWSPIVVVTESSIYHVLDLSIKIDVIIHTAATSNAMQLIAEEQYPVKLIETEQTDLLAAIFKYLLARKQRAINIIGNASTIIQSLSPELLSHFRIVIFEQDYKIFHVSDGKFSKWAPTGQVFETLPDQEISEVKNLRRTSSQLYSTFTTEQDGFIQLNSLLPFWIRERIGSSS